MSDESAEARIEREDKETEALGLAWRARSDAYLVGYVDAQRAGRFHTPAIVEMQRRLSDAVRSSGRSADRQAGQMFALTIAVGLLTLVQACAAVAPIFRDAVR